MLLWLAMFAALTLAYGGLRALDMRTTLDAQALGAVEGSAAVRGAGGLVDAHKFVVRGLLWMGAALVLFVVALATVPVVHGLWLGLYGALLVRSVRAIAGNKEWAREHGRAPGT